MGTSVGVIEGLNEKLRRSHATLLRSEVWEEDICMWPQSSPLHPPPPSLTHPTLTPTASFSDLNPDAALTHPLSALEPSPAPGSKTTSFL
ncbi:unnamed protein product [Gadus morhua 'NCC']